MASYDLNLLTDAWLRGWNRIPLFWRFQTIGWLTLFVTNFPLKLIVLGTLQSALFVSLYREGMGFITTWGMREIYRRIYQEPMGLNTLGLLVVSVSLSGALVQSALALGFHDFFDFEENKVFKEGAAFATIYFRSGLCFAWSFLYFGIKLWRKQSADRLRLALIESEKKCAELQMLRAQLNPHFLFNALNSILAEINNPNADAKASILSLSEFLRYSLEHRGDSLVELQEELRAIGCYLTVEKARFRDDLEFEFRVDENLNTAPVPGIILQPLVENAVKYGWKTSPRPLQIRIEISRSSYGGMRIAVSNTGQWFAKSVRKAGGMGIGNLRARLDLFYPDSHKFETVAADGWVTIQIDIPYDTDTSGTTRSNHR